MIQVPSILTGFATKVDGGASIRFSTNELTDTDVLELKKHQGKFGFLLFKENTFEVDDIPKQDADEEGKTPSRRLRAVLFVRWKQLGEKGDFEVFYREHMEKLIDHIKGKLD